MQPILSTFKLIDWREVFLIVAQGLLICAVATYVAGEYTGRKMYAASEWLAHHWPSRPTGSIEQPVPVPAPIVTVARATTDADALTARIRALREQGWTQQRIADAVGVSRSTVRRRLAAAC
jgi:DNA-binding NarL/FixJ family response regulator